MRYRVGYQVVGHVEIEAESAQAAREHVARDLSVDSAWESEGTAQGVTKHIEASWAYGVVRPIAEGDDA